MSRDLERSLPVGTLVRCSWWRVGRHARAAQVVEHLGNLILLTHACRELEATPSEVRKITPQPIPVPFVSMRLALPCGVYVNDETGREVLYNRDYEPIWERTGEVAPLRCDPAERIRHNRQEWFYNDGNPPWRDIKSMRRCLDVLASWGAERPALTGVPR
ncbi:hypothetical protein [Roseomonas chloroacetimidivorans]|uniref:hypothetical protein n=1 Tax=Roseomonas chloroacetimidivorans TaxID=1766656 RepID=UPI003C7498A1